MILSDAVKALENVRELAKNGDVNAARSAGAKLREDIETALASGTAGLFPFMMSAIAVMAEDAVA